MGSTVAHAVAPRHRLLDELPPAVMAKASSRNLNSNFQAEIGRCVARARLLVGWSKKELAAACDKDEAQISRWEAGKERPQFDALWSIAKFRAPLVIAMAELVDGVQVDTVIRVKVS